MKLLGYQPVSVVDYPNQLASVCFMGGCPLRCAFCHNPQLVLPDLLQKDNKEEEYLVYLKQRKNMLDGVVISGGEPLMQDGIVEFLIKIKDLGYKIKVDTCGVYPEILQKIIEKNLVDYVAMDYKNEDSLFLKTVARNKQPRLLSQWKKSLAILRDSSIEYELRTTLVKEMHSLESLQTMAKQLNAQEIWYWQSFVYKDKVLNDYLQANQAYKLLTSIPPQELEQYLRVIKQEHTQTYIR